MIVEVLIGACVVAAAGVVGEALRRRRRVWRAGASAAASTPRAARGLRVGDVLLPPDGELWLAGALHLTEDGLVARLFVAPGDPDRWLAQLDPDGRELYVLSATSELTAGTVPHVMPFQGVRYTTRRRRRVTVRSEGEHLPSLGSDAAFVELAGPGGKLVIVLDGAAERLVLVGDRLLREMADLLPGADAPAD